jgi:hypothetical protein
MEQSEYPNNSEEHRVYMGASFQYWEILRFEMIQHVHGENAR